MKRNLRGQMVGFHHPCIEFNPNQTHEYYEFLHEADEFGSAAGAYPDERAELLANCAHRYQLLVDLTTARLQLNVSFLNKGKIWFNFYSDIATHFGLGTQAYTTETRRPHVGISEISLQDAYLLQLILLHEMQHAIDFANYSGLQMSISERELRARISICEGLLPLKARQEEMYGHALKDLCYWYVLFFLTGGIDETRRQDYYDLLGEDARYVLSSAGGGVSFPPMVLRALAKELMRDRLTLNAFQRYAVDQTGKGLALHLLDGTGDAGREPDALEALMLADDKLAPNTVQLKDLSKEELGQLSVDYSRDLLTTRNRLSDWSAYDKQYEKLKEQAQAAIERDKPSFESVQLRLETGAGHLIENSLFEQVEDFVKKEPSPKPRNPLEAIELPAAVQKTDEATAAEKEHGATAVMLEPLQGRYRRHNIEEELTLEDQMADLSDFVKERGGR